MWVFFQANMISDSFLFAWTQHIAPLVTGTSLIAQLVKNLPAMQETPSLIPGTRRSPGEGIGYPLQYSCLNNPHGPKSLAGYSPWGCKVSDTTERLSSVAHSRWQINTFWEHKRREWLLEKQRPFTWFICGQWSGPWANTGSENCYNHPVLIAKLTVFFFFQGLGIPGNNDFGRDNSNRS